MTKQTVFNIRYAEEIDAQSIAEIHVASWREAYNGLISSEFLNSLSIPERTKMWKSLLQNNVRILLIEKTCRVVGFLSFCPARDADKDKDKCVEVTALYLHPTEWRKGFGENLMATALSEFKKSGFKEVVLWVMENNRLGKNFYEKIGFEPTGDVKEEYHNNMPTPIKEIRYSKYIQ